MYVHAVGTSKVYLIFILNIHHFNITSIIIWIIDTSITENQNSQINKDKFKKYYNKINCQQIASIKIKNK